MVCRLEEVHVGKFYEASVAVASAAEPGVDGCGVSNILCMHQIKGPVGWFSDNWVKACKDEA
jgi:hypothetical protein